MRPSVLILLCAIALGVGVAQVDVYPTEVQPPEVKVVERTKTIVKEVRVPVKQPDGYMGEDQCGKIAKGTELRDLLFQYGWPSNDNGDDSFAGFLRYPLREDHERFCTVDMWGGEVDGTSMDL